VRIPDPDQLGSPPDEVLAVIYLVFNEGYLASAGRTPARRDLAAQAVALNRLLRTLMPGEPEVLGLLALMLLHESRAATRFDGWGRLVRWPASVIAPSIRYFIPPPVCDVKAPGGALSLTPRTARLRFRHALPPDTMPSAAACAPSGDVPAGGAPVA
jgi:hypothetical protein